MSPTFMAAAAPYFAAGSAAIGAIGAINQGRASNQAAQAQAAHYKAQAERERQLGLVNQQRLSKENEALAGRQRALLAGQGRDIGSGSALLVQSDLAEEGAYNEQLALANAEDAAYGKKAQAALELAEGRGAKTAGYFKAGTTLLTAGSKFT